MRLLKTKDKRSLVIYVSLIILAGAFYFYYFMVASNVFHRTIQACIAILCMLIMLLAVYLVLNKNKALQEDKNQLAELNERLVEKEELFRRLFEQSPLGISFGNHRNAVINTNRKFEEIIGRTKEELANATWMDITHPDDIEKDMDNFEMFKAGKNDGYTMEKRYIRPDGSSVWVNMTIAPLKLGNKENRSHICIVEDITGRKQTDMDFKETVRSNTMLLSNIPGMAYRCKFDKAWTMLFISEGCYDLTGYRPESFLNNQEITFSDIILSDYRELLWDKWCDTLRDRKVFKEEYPITTASGKVKWVYEQGQCVYDEKGEVKVIEGLIIDISDRRQKEDEIRYLNHHDVLTGLYNRRYFEEEKLRLDYDNMYPLSVIIGDINGLKVFNDALGHAEGDRLIISAAEILMSCCREGDTLARTGGDEFSLLLPRTTKEEADKLIRKIGSICEKYRLKIRNESYHISISLGCSSKISKAQSFNKVIREAEEKMYQHKLLQNKSLHSSLISSMKSALYAKSQQTEEHAQRIIEISKAIGVNMDLSDAQLNELALLSTLHDIGKIGISDNILNKPGKLTPEEWIDMKKHPEIGFRIAMSTPDLVPIAEYILTHHERWDGSGYPQGIKGEEIPLLSRIIAVADAYDAMTADRPYRKALSNEIAIQEIMKNAGTQFDPKIAELFLELYGKGDILEIGEEI